MTEKEIEQMEDIDWAATVLRGDGLSTDSREAALAVLTVLVEHGATEQVRRRADNLLYASRPKLMVVA